jgi:hypothetical protein
MLVLRTLETGMQISTRHPGRAYGRALSSSLRELRGVVERVTYHNPENGYTVARLAPELIGLEAEAIRGDDRLVTIVGTLADLMPGEAIVAHGWLGPCIGSWNSVPAAKGGEG